MITMKGRVAAIRTNPPRNELSELDIEVDGGRQSITIKAAAGESIWDALKNQHPVTVTIVSNRLVLPEEAR